MSIKKLNYKSISLSTSIARNNKPIRIKGNSILIIQSPVNISIRLHSINNDKIVLKQYDSIVEDFQEFFISHGALTDGNIEIIVYNDQQFKIFLAGRQSAGGGATVVNDNSLALTLANTEYNISLLDSTKKLILINNSNDAMYRFSFVALSSTTGIPIPPLSLNVIDSIDFVNAKIYAQSDVASKILYFWEFL